MQVILEIIDGPGTGQRIMARPGEQLTVGRTEQSDYAFPENAELSSVHFAVVWGEGMCRVRDLNSTNGTLLNGERVTESSLHDGDQIKAGQAHFGVHVDDLAASPDTSVKASLTPPSAVAPVPPPSPSPTVEAQLPPLGSDGTLPASGGPPPPAPLVPPAPVPMMSPPPPPSAAAPTRAAAAPAASETSKLADESGFVERAVPEICADIEELGDDAKAMALNKQTPQEFLKDLYEKELLEDALRFLAYALCKRSAVGWACRCVQETAGDELEPNDAAALQVVQRWVLEPNEPNRRAAETAAAELEYATPSSWVAMGAFWSEGSVAPPEAPVIEAKPQLTAHAVSGAVLLAAVEKEPEKAPEKQKKYIEWGVEAGSV